MEPTNSGLKTWQWVVTAIVIVVLIVIGIFVFGKKSPSTDNTPSDTMGTSTPATNTPGVNNIVMSDQYPGNVVYLSSVTMANGGWVEIHKDNNGQPGAIIGSAWVDAGTSPVKVTVSSPIVDGGTYYAMLHSDNGDKKFDSTVDLPLKDSNGNVIMRVFHGSVSAGNNIKG
jgi:hypothetical protein